MMKKYFKLHAYKTEAFHWKPIPPEKYTYKTAMNINGNEVSTGSLEKKSKLWTRTLYAYTFSVS